MLGSPARGEFGKGAGLPESLGQGCDGREETVGPGQGLTLRFDSLQGQGEMGLGRLCRSGASSCGVEAQGPQGLVGQLLTGLLGACEPPKGRVVGIEIK